MTTIDISGLDKAAVLAALYNGAAPVGLGFLQAGSAPQTMTAEQAESLIAGSLPHLYFDYVAGRPLKADLAEDTLDPRLYDRDQGQGAAARAIEHLRQTSEVSSDEAAARRAENTQLNAHEAMTIANIPSGRREGPGIPVFEIGGAHVGEQLEKAAVDREVARVQDGSA